MFDAINDWVMSVYVRFQTWLYCMKEEERGDTNFISIIIILGIVLILATAFIAYKDQIVKQTSEQVSKFKLEG